MNREEKGAIVAELQEKFARARLAILTECSGLSVNQVSELRKRLRGAQAEYRVVKNTMAVRAAEGTMFVEAKPYLIGPVALVIGYDDPVLPTKILKEFIQGEKRDQKLKIKLGLLDGKLLEPPQVIAVANLPGRPVLLSMLLSGLQGPIRNLVSVFSGVLRGFVGVIRAIEERRKEGGQDMPATEGKLLQEDFIKAVESMSVLELSELVKGLEERFGVTAAAPVAVVAAPGVAAPVAEEKDSFDVVLAGHAADKKIQVIKVVRELTSLGLKEAKDLVEGAPKAVKTGVTKEEAEAMKKKLEDGGGTVEVK